ncbi:MAG: hypothetical protein HUJ73_04230, partial [Eubacterium sp.]|nr:hypothetical protein [Eubacterium sp.]
YDEAKEDFGCASFGLAGSEDPLCPCRKSFDRDLEGTMLCGSYENILSSVPEGRWQAAVVLLGNAGGENVFVRSLSEKAGCPVTGGAAAIDPVDGRKGLIPGRGEAAVFLISDPRYKIEVFSQNIHSEILGTYSVTFEDPRFADQIDGQDALSWLTAQKERLGIPASDFEHLTLCDPSGINAHLSAPDGKLFSGRDLAPEMILRYVPDADEAMAAFYDDPDAVIFGCAGLKSLLTRPMPDTGLGLFMFGEVCTVDGVSDFGNLMLSKLRVTPV